MINKNFKRDWKLYGGEVNIIDTKHFSLDFDKDCIAFKICFSWKFRLLVISIFNLVFRFY